MESKTERMLISIFHRCWRILEIKLASKIHPALVCPAWRDVDGVTWRGEASEDVDGVKGEKGAHDYARTTALGGLALL